MQTTFQKLRNRIKMDSESISLLDQLQKEHVIEITELEEGENEMRGYHSIDLGIDTIHYRLEHGNLLIQQKLESFFRSATTTPHAEPLLFP